MIESLLFLILGTIHNPDSDDYMMLQWAMGLSLCSLILLPRFKGAKLPLLLFIYTMASGCFTLAFRRTTPFISSAVYSTFSVFAISTFCLLASKARIEKMLKAIPYLTVFNALIVTIGSATGEVAKLFLQIPHLPHKLFVIGTHIGSIGKMPGSHGYIGLINYSGMNGTLLAIGIPSVIHMFGEAEDFKQKVAWLFSFAVVGIAILLSASSIPYGIMAVGSAAMFLHFKRDKVGILLSVLSTAIILSCAYGTERAHLFDSAFRFPAYKLYMTQWYEHAHWFTGTGQGTFQVIGPMVQKEFSFMVNTDPNKTSFFWLWLHSDWLQVLFEGGIIAFLLYASLFANMLKKFWREQTDSGAFLFATTAAFGSAAIFNFPVRYFVMAFLVGLLVRAAYETDLTLNQKIHL